MERGGAGIASSVSPSLVSRGSSGVLGGGGGEEGGEEGGGLFSLQNYRMRRMLTWSKALTNQS